MRKHWAAALRSRLDGDGGPYGLLDPAALTEAAELVAATTDPGDLVETCHLVGMLHYRRGAAFADARTRPEVWAATALLLVVHGSDSGLPLPPVLRDSFPPADPAPVGWAEALRSVEVALAQTDDPHFLRMAISLGRNAAEDAPPGDPRRPAFLSFLALAQERRFEHTGDLVAITEAITTARLVLSSTPSDAPDRPLHLANLASLLRSKAERTGDPGLLEEAIALARDAAGRDHPARFLALNTLGVALRLLAERTDDPALLPAAVDAAGAAVAMLDTMPATRQDHAVLTNLATTLAAQHEHTGDPATLDRAIAAGRRAVAATIPDTPPWWASRYNLGSHLRARFDRTGDLAALTEAIATVSEAVEALPADHPDIPPFQSALVGQLIAHFQRTGDDTALDEAMDRGRAAVRATPADHPRRMEHLTNFAVAIKVKGESRDDPELLLEAVRLLRTAAGDHAPPVIATNLGNALATYAELTGDPAAAAEAIDWSRRALAGVAATDARRAGAECNLAGALRTGGDRAEAVELFAAAAGRAAAPVGVRVRAARECGRLADDPRRKADAYAVAVELLPRLAARELVRTDAARWLAEQSQLASDAAACALTAGRVERAVELLELGRGVLLAQALESRTDLSELRERDPALADRFAHLCARLDSEPTDLPDERRDLATELAATVEQIRARPGLDRFLLPPTAADLRAGLGPDPVVMINTSRYRCDALILTRHRIDVVRLPALTLADLRTRLTALGEAVNQRHGSLAARVRGDQTLQAILGWLWDTVTGPVLHHLAPDRPERIWWVPGGLLSYFPLHAAGHHRDAPGLERRTVLDRVVSSYTPTVRALTGTAQPHRPHRDGRSMLTVAMPQTPGEADLPGARREVETLARLVPGMTTLIAAEATHDAVLARLPGSAWAHFACHAGIDPRDPGGSRLLVHDHAERPLGVAEISRLRLTGPHLAYLSACSTAVTAPELADEVLHIVTAFRLAGYADVIGTLWPIADTDAADIAELVYTDLLTGGDAGLALHRAIRTLRDRHPATPSRWAAHLHVGTTPPPPLPGHHAPG